MISTQTVKDMKDFAKGAKDTLSGVMKDISMANDRLHRGSITKYIRSSYISCRVLIEDRCADSAILPDVVGVVQQMYYSWIMVAMNMANYTEAARTTKVNLLQLVGTESLEKLQTIPDASLARAFKFGTGGYEALSPEAKRRIEAKLREEEEMVGYAERQRKIDKSKAYDEEERLRKEEELKARNHNQWKREQEFIKNYRENERVNEERAIKERDKNDVVVSSKISEIPKDTLVPAGRIIDSTITVNGATMSLTMYLQTYPSIIHTDTLAHFFKLGAKQSIAQRFMQVTTGEKKFFKDFLFEIDKAEDRRKALKNDKTGELNDLLQRQNESILKHAKAISERVERHNIANSIIVIDKYSFQKWSKDLGINFKSQGKAMITQLSGNQPIKALDDFFARTYSTALVIIDNDYQTVDFLFAGLNNIGTYSFKQLEKQSKDEKYDLSSIMKSFYQSQAPRF